MWSDDPAHIRRKGGRKYEHSEYGENNKKIYPFCVILVKIENFYNVYGKDAYIYSYLFDYKIVEKAGILY